MKITPHFSLLLLPAAALLAPTSSAQFPVGARYHFSFDFKGPSRSAPSCSGAPMMEGDIMSPCVTGLPDMPRVPGALPPPRIAVPFGFGGLGLPGACAGAAPGTYCSPGLEVDAFSHGMDGPIDPNIFVPGSNFFQKTNYHFSVDEWAQGTGFPTSPTVMDESGVMDAAADIFLDRGFQQAPPFMPFAGGNPGNIADVDGDGRPQFPTYWAYPGTGLIEPTAPGPLPAPGDNLDALDFAEGLIPAGTLRYFSLDSGFIDPRSGNPNTGSAAALGFSGADVLVSGGGAPAVWAPANLLGLDLVGGPDSDDIDGIIIWNNFNPTYQPSFQAYDWIVTPNNVDMLLFTVRAGSAVIGMPDSRFGLPIEPGDILSTPLATFFGGVSPFPSIWIPAEDLGLRVSTARGGIDPIGDDVDALDYSRIKQLVAHEYCFGDGGLAGCTSCPCGNDMPAGNQTGCRNSAGTGARLEVSGYACVTNDTLRFEMTGAVPISFAILIAGTTRLPVAGPCPPGSGITQPILDGLRCLGGNQLRFPARPTDANGDVGVTNNGWGGTSGPPGGLLNYAGIGIPCQTWQFQSFYRENAALGCMTGIATSQAVQVFITP